MYKVNVPLGYSGVPFCVDASYDRGNVQTAREHKSSVSSILPFVSSGTSEQFTEAENMPDLVPKGLMDKLPLEIRLNIAYRLSQYDAFSLMRVNRAFFESTVVRLYHTVVVDPSYSQFNQIIYLNELSQCKDNASIGCSFIRMNYSLKSFLKVINKSIPLRVSGSNNSAAPLYGYFINTLQFVDLPDGFTSAFDLSFFSYMSIKRLINLNRFYWDCREDLFFEFINRLPSKANFRSLHVSLDFRKLKTSDDLKAFQGFNNLQRLSIEPFASSLNLFYMFKNLLENCDELKLKLLRLRRMNPNSSFSKAPSCSLLVLTNHILEAESVDLSDYDTDTILNLFILFCASDKQLDVLESFCLDSIIVQTIDAQRLDSFIDLSKLKHLELNNIVELQMPENIFIPLTMNELYNHLDGGFLLSLSKRLKNLTCLSIDYRESLRDTIPAFISSFEGLQELDITIRWNVTKLSSVPSWRHLCVSYTKAILKHSSTLKKLSLDSKEDSVFCDLHKLIYSDCLLDLRELTHLESLRLHGYSLHPYAPVLVSYFPRLRFLELFGTGSGGAPHMGLQVAHLGVLDDWLRVQHVAVAINENNTDIEFIKIDKCLFEVKDKFLMVPRDGLEKWFESKVRVCLSRVDF